jgi:hypothetical protein
MLRAGAGLPALMNLLALKTAAPSPQANPSVAPLRAGPAGVIDALSGAHHVLEMFRLTRQPYPHVPRPLSNRLTEIVTVTKSLGLN